MFPTEIITGVKFCVSQQGFPPSETKFEIDFNLKEL